MASLYSCPVSSDSSLLAPTSPPLQGHSCLLHSDLPTLPPFLSTSKSKASHVLEIIPRKIHSDPRHFLNVQRATKLTCFLSCGPLTSARRTLASDIRVDIRRASLISSCYKVIARLDSSASNAYRLFIRYFLCLSPYEPRKHRNSIRYLSLCLSLRNNTETTAAGRCRLPRPVRLS